MKAKVLITLVAGDIYNVVTNGDIEVHVVDFDANRSHQPESEQISNEDFEQRLKKECCDAKAPSHETCEICGKTHE